MNAGLLNEPITILMPVTELDKFGADKQVWREVRSTKARVESPGSKRTIENGEIFFSIDAVFTIRIYHKVDSSMRIRWRGKDYRITGIDPDRAQMSQHINTELINE